MSLTETVQALIESNLDPEVKAKAVIALVLSESGRKGGRPRKDGTPSYDEVSKPVSEPLVSRQEESSLISEKGRGSGGGETEAKVSEPVSEPVAEIPPFPVDGGGGEWRMTAAFLAELQAAYPSIDAKQETLQARVWIIGNPERRKTLGGMPRFISNWFKRAQNNGSGVRKTGPPRAAPVSRPWVSPKLPAPWPGRGGEPESIGDLLAKVAK